MVGLILVFFVIFPRLINDLAEWRALVFKREWAYLVSLGFVGLTALTYLNQAPVEIVLVDLRDGLSLGLRLDVLSGLISTTVLLIGASVMRYSIRYLEDDKNRVPFQKNLTNTLSLVLVMLNSSNLLMFWLAWVGTSYFLHNLLLHFKQREGAQVAAHQKFWVSRIGDCFIIFASVMLFRIFGSLDFEIILNQSVNSSVVSSNYTLSWFAGIFLVLGAMTKSAQFPFHYWLPKTMETPTPVSALMHAGIINAGGFLIVRMGGFLNEVPFALNLLALVGGFTAFYGSIIMLTQTSVKKSLAYSTISQMGFMMLQCGLGAFSIAIVHLIGHAFYKAYSFLGSGAVTDYGKLNRYITEPQNESWIWSPFIIGFLGVCFTLLSGPMLGYNFEKPGAVILLLVLGFAVSQIYLSYVNKLEACKSIAILMIAYFSLYHGVDFLLRSSMPTQASNLSVGQYPIYTILGLLFTILYLCQNNLDRISQTKIGQKLYVKSLNGGFLG